MIKNQECLESILGHLTKLILLTETGNVKELEKLVDMATSVSAQLLATDKYTGDDDDVSE